MQKGQTKHSLVSESATAEAATLPWLTDTDFTGLPTEKVNILLIAVIYEIYNQKQPLCKIFLIPGILMQL